MRGGGRGGGGGAALVGIASGAAADWRHPIKNTPADTMSASRREMSFVTLLVTYQTSHSIVGFYRMRL
jgi:hypothetical protein